MVQDDYRYKLLEFWTTCVDLKGYNKKHWQFLSRIMDLAMSYNDDSEAQKFVLYLARVYLQAHKDGTLDRS
jgi:hypothetical protein